MADSTVAGRQLEDRDTFARNEANSSGVSWAAVIAGAFVAASLWLILLIFGTGLGASSVSPGLISPHQPRALERRLSYG